LPPRHREENKKALQKCGAFLFYGLYSFILLYIVLYALLHKDLLHKIDLLHNEITLLVIIIRGIVALSRAY
jgi:hypothetical protein